MITEYDFVYCPQCATPFEKKDEYLFCPECKLQYYINPKPTNAVLLKNSHGKILLVKRKHDPGKGLWDLPGGFINVEETIEESIHREVMEEINVKIKNLKYLSSFHEPYEFGGIRANTICSLFEAEMIDPERIQAADDVESVSYFDPSNIPFEDFAFESMKKTLKEIIL